MTFWDSRFGGDDFLYGREPNEFFASFLSKIKKKGKILLPAEGEGRNAVFAAKAGWEVTAIDSSSVACEKALRFAKNEGVTINYEILDLTFFEARPGQFDLIALVFGHFISSERKVLHQKLTNSLKSGGHLLIEAFAKEQINNNSGGPQDIDLLYSISDFEDDFSEISILQLTHERVFLNEGRHHGWADVIRFVGKKAV